MGPVGASAAAARTAIPLDLTTTASLHAIVVSRVHPVPVHAAADAARLHAPAPGVLGHPLTPGWAIRDEQPGVMIGWVLDCTEVGFQRLVLPEQHTPTSLLAWFGKDVSEWSPSGPTSAGVFPAHAQEVIRRRVIQLENGSPLLWRLAD